MNLLFILDNSYSMLKPAIRAAEPDDSDEPTGIDPETPNRMQALQSVFRQVMYQTPDYFNVGLIRFGGQRFPHPAGILFPVSPIDANTESIIGPYKGVDNLPNPDSTITVRNFLPDIVDTWVPEGATPIVESLYESYLYYTGNPVSMGKFPPSHPNASHPSTYEDAVDMNKCTEFQSYFCFDDPKYGGCPDNKHSCVKYRRNGLPSIKCNASDCKRSSGYAKYISPVKYACQSNYAILMTDGKPKSYTEWSNANYSWFTGTIKSLHPDAKACEESPNGFENGTCGAELTKHMSESDIAPKLAGKQNIEVFVIGLGISGLAAEEEYLKSLITPKGRFYLADTPDELMESFLAAINKMSGTGFTFNTPATSLNKSHSLAHGEAVYLPVFDSAFTSLWRGNLRKFKRKNGIIVDENNRPAFDDMGRLVDTAKDVWSEVAAGDDTTKGGAAALLNPKTRSLWTNIDNNLVKLGKETSAITPALFGLGSESALSSDDIEKKRDAYIDFIRGYDKAGKPSRHMGDMLHSKPVPFDYKNESVVFAATNEGYLHAFKTTDLDSEQESDGVEKWAFMPSRLLKNVPTFYDNKARTHVYGIDGELTFWENDINRNGDIEPDQGEGIYVFFGLGRGGNAYYALDITNPDQPQLAWEIDGRNANSDFRYLGETWSKPTLGKMYVPNPNYVKPSLNTTTAANTAPDSNPEPKYVLKYVLIFGGGYDPVKDEADRAKRPRDQLGKDVFIIDALTGKRLWSLQKDASIMGGNQLEHSVAGNIRVLDMNFDGSLDRLYFADTGGNVWRVDMDIDINDKDESLYDYSDAKVSLFANISDSSAEGDRMFFNSPDVSMMYHKGKPVIIVSIGSGYRMHPLDTKTTNYFFVMRDDNVKTPPPEDNRPLSMNDIVFPYKLGGSSFLDTDNKGWRRKLKLSGEKAITDSVTLMNKVMFTTLAVTDAQGEPQDLNDVCNAPQNTARVYVLDILTGLPAMDLNRDGKIENTTGSKDEFVIAGSGVVGTPQLIFLPPSAKDGSGCKKDDCQQIVEVRVGTLKLPVIDANNSSNDSITSSVDLSLITEKVYWRTQAQ